MKTTAKQAEIAQAIQAKANRQAPVNSILQAYKNHAIQRQSVDEEELLQGKFEPAQLKSAEEEELLQGKFSAAQLQTEEEEPLQKKENNTGLPDQLKSGIENLSGYSMDDVKVHYNSAQPATLQAHAYAQGTDIHIAPGQEQHLPHEAWHVVQQKQGRVKPTMQMKGKVPVNDDAGLENEADVMGGKALQTKNLRISNQVQLKGNQPKANYTQTVQRVWIQTSPDVYAWHAARNGVIWYYNVTSDLMYFIIQKFPSKLPKEIQGFYLSNLDKEYPYEKWIKLMSEGFGELSDKDDPVYENPEFLVDEESEDKIALLQQASKILRAHGIQVFLGGAASGALLTKTRKVKDLDLRMDGQPRDIFNKSKHGEFFRDKIVLPLSQNGFNISKVEVPASTTTRFMLNEVEVSITSEPSTETTMTRGETVSDIESLGEIDFILDKVAAAADREDINKMVTDIFDVIMVIRSMPGGFYVLNAVSSLRPKSAKKIQGLVNILKQIVNTAREYKNPNIKTSRVMFCSLLKIDSENLPTFLDPIIKELSNQQKTIVL